MEKILITGFAGFVARHFTLFLSQQNQAAQVIGLDRNEPQYNFASLPDIHCNFSKTNLTDKNALLDVIKSFKPDYILHLASASSVQYSWQYPAECFLNNNGIFLALLDAVKESGIQCRILSTGSSDVYGLSANNFAQITEDALLNPLSPYAAAKASQEMLAKIYTESFGLDIIQTRSFTHFGPYQKENFVLAKFAKHFTQIKKGQQKPELVTGNIDVIRDMTDVRDVVKAYHDLFKQGQSGEIYNVCSGTGRSLRSVIELMEKQTGIQVELSLDKNLLRSGEILSIIGSNEKIKKETGWQPQIPFENSIADLLTYWETV